jgi:hypothetical protein
MPKGIFYKSPQGGLFPVNQKAVNIHNRMQDDSRYVVSIYEERNIKFHRKIFALLKFAYENTEKIQAEYKGEIITMSFKKFRKDMVIMAGFYSAQVGINGNIILIADSIGFDKCSQSKAEKIYNKLLDVVASRIFNGGYSREKLDELTNRWLGFC